MSLYRSITVVPSYAEELIELRDSDMLDVLISFDIEGTEKFIHSLQTKLDQIKEYVNGPVQAKTNEETRT